MRDQYNREIDYMRISLTDYCNLQCSYCGTGSLGNVSKRLLSKEDILMICRQAVRLGICHFKLTGGEPLLRSELTSIVRELKELPGVATVTLTTNGTLLSGRIQELVDAGLDAVTVSLDTLCAEKYAKITGVDCHLQVVKAIRESSRLLQTKINVVLQEGIHEEECFAFVEFGNQYHVDVRFIELMPFGGGRDMASMDGGLILEKLKERFPDMEAADSAPEANMEPLGISDAKVRNGPAVYYRIPGYACEIGFISAVHRGFCDGCNRIRLTAGGELKSCLCYDSRVSLWEKLSLGNLSVPDKEAYVYEALKRVIFEKPKGHSFGDVSRISEERSLREIGG